MPDHPLYRSPVLAHRGLIAGLFDALRIGDGLEHATHPHPARRDLTVGEAANALVLNGLGLIHHARDIVPRCFHHQPTARLSSPRGPRTAP
jgi:hypothetical protein